MATRKQLEQQYIQDRAFWASIGARWRGLAGGLLVGGATGAVLGLATAGIYAATTGTGFSEMVVHGAKTLMGIVGFYAGAGMLVGSNLWAGAGSTAGAVAAGLMAQKELEKGKSAELEKEVTVDKPAPPPPKQPLCNWKVAAIGALASGAVGAFLVATNALPAGASYILLGQQAGSYAAVGAAALTMGLFGCVFGVAFRPWQAVKQWTDGLFEGKLSGRGAPEMDVLKANLVEQTHGLSVQEAENMPSAFVERLQAQRAEYSAKILSV